MSYFSFFPTTLYDPHGIGSQKLATNLLKRVRIRTNMKKEFILLDPYDVQEGETPEIVADKHHGSPYYHWVVMILNGISHPIHDWPKTTREMQLYLKQKYGLAAGQDSVHHYEIEQQSGNTKTKIEVTDLINYPSASTVTNYEYEQKRQDELREVRLLDPQYIKDFVREYKLLMNESSI